jgi:hypothetical protein
MTANAASTDSPPGDPASSARRYSAFISYTGADRAIARRLQGRLERYRLPRRLAKQVGFDRIKPVFVDRSELRAERDLDDALRDALDRADCLIVLSTPRTPASQWVGREIDVFRELHGDRNILVALFEGESDDAFHPRLLAGHAERVAEPLAADFRREGDGYRLAMLKLVAALLGVNLDDLVQRDGKRRREQLLLSIAAFAAVALVIGALSFIAWRESESGDADRIRASLAMERQLAEMRVQIKAGGTLDMAAALNRNVELFYDQQQGASGLPEIELGRAQLLHAKVEDERKRGNLDAAAADARAAWQFTAKLLARQPDNPDALYAHAQSAYWVAYLAWQRRDTPLAANAFGRYADLADALVKLDPANDEWRFEQGYAYSNLGMVALLEARDTPRAQRYFTAAQTAFRDVEKRTPADPDALYEIADGEAWLADVEQARGDYGAAQRHRDEQARLVAKLLRSDPRNQLYRGDLVASRIGQGRLFAAQGKFREAVRTLRSAHTEASALLAADPKNGTVASQKRAIELFLAQNEFEAGALDRAARALGNCARDWAGVRDDELAAYCSILGARIALARKQEARARQIMADPRLDEWLTLRTLSPTWRLDLAVECGKLPDASLCRRPVQPRQPRP